MTTRPGEPEYYTDEAGEVRWRVQDSNGEITEASTEGFVNLRNAFDNYTITRGNVQISYEEAEAQIHGNEEGDDTAGDRGQLADNGGSAGEEEADTNSGEGGTGGSSGVGA